jgi:thiosulfate/3-mercaptopyruvate sulfurtransferase
MTLISVEELAGRLGDPDVRVADVRWYLGQPERGRQAYQAGHLPGAIRIDLEDDLAAPPSRDGGGRHPLPDPLVFAERLGRHGIGNDHLVVAYDDAGGAVAGRLWWMLDSLGHRGAAVLDGGVAAWLDAGHQLVTDVPRYPAARLVLADRWRNVISRDELITQLGDVTLLDLRAAERYRGETEPVDPVAGHIPTARSLPAARNLDPSSGRFAAADELGRRYAEVGAADGPVVSCGSGVTACQAALALRVAGLPDPQLYVGSWSDWSTAGLPVATGPQPGQLPADAAPRA